MSNFTTKQEVLFYCYSLNEKQRKKIDEFLQLLNESGVSEVIQSSITNHNIDRRGFNPYAIFATVIYGFAVGTPTLRELESSCRYDLRFIYLMGGETPTYATFANYINKVIAPQADLIFARIVQAILRRCGLTLDDCHIDGTKFEARANKYKAVWKPTTFHKKLSDKARHLLSDLGLSRGVPTEGIISSSMLANKLIEAQHLPLSAEPKEEKVQKKKVENLSAYLTKTLEYEEKERICGPNRNSYYKTDHDATAMCLKQDYYSGLGSNLHAAYQMQTVVAHGLVLSYYVSQDRVDIHTFIPSLEHFYEMYGRYPKSITADAGYGSQDNYEFCLKNGIEAFVKYASWEGECSGRRPALYELHTDGTIICLGGQSGQLTEIEERHHKIKGGRFYRVQCPLDCPFMLYCRQFHKQPQGSERTFEINPKYQLLKQEARDRLLSVRGIELRVNRSAQIEGVYGITKHNMGYTRARRIGMTQVRTEYMLTVTGLNIRKFFRYLDGKRCFDYWKAPEKIKPETFKKPSAKRLVNRALKKRMKQPNEIARESYKYKKSG